MSSIEEKLTRQIVQKTSSRVTLAIIGSGAFTMTYIALHARAAVLAAVCAACSLVALLLVIRRSLGVRFLPDGIEELGRRGKSTFIAYADIDSLRRVGDEFVIETRGRTVRLGREGSREPYVADVLVELGDYLEKKVAEAQALAEDREAVEAFLASGAPAGDDYRSLPRPRSALEAVARSRVMPARLRARAAKALGEDVLEELSDEISNASESGRRRV